MKEFFDNLKQKKTQKYSNKTNIGPTFKIITR